MMMNCHPRAFARCPYNKTCISVEMAEFTENSDCHRYNNKVLDMPPTNADRIRGMEDKEMADFIMAVAKACAEKACDSCPIGKNNCKNMVKWLKKEGDHQ